MTNYEKRLQYGHSDFFGRIAVPFYSVTFRLDVTRLKARCREENLPFYYAMMYVTMRAVNSVEEFRYEMRDGLLTLRPYRSPSYTFPYEEEIFGICGVEWDETESAADFTARCKAAEQALTAPLPTAEEDASGCDVYLSCLPWFDYGHMTQEFDLDRDDSTPRILWGKFTADERGTLTLPYTVQVNHRFLDGVHLGKLYEALNRELREF